MAARTSSRRRSQIWRWCGAATAATIVAAGCSGRARCRTTLRYRRIGRKCHGARCDRQPEDKYGAVDDKVRWQSRPGDQHVDMLSRCLGVATEVHHCQEVGAGGSDDMSNLISVCTHCHAKITATRYS